MPHNRGMMRRAVLVLPDQLTDQVGPVAEALAGDSNKAPQIIMVEARDAWALPRHIQALVSQVAAGREFASSLRGRGLTVIQVTSDSLESGLQQLAKTYTIKQCTVMEPASPEDLTRLRAAVAAAGIELNVVPNALWLTSRTAWDEFREGRRELRMEFWYRRVRADRGWLMESTPKGAKPVGGEWNLDHDNRQRLPKGAKVPAVPNFPRSKEVLAAIKDVTPYAVRAFGDAEAFDWPTTRVEALEALEHFCADRLAEFGPYEDAMSTDHQHLFHSLLSSSMNLGLLTPEEVCERALKEWKKRPKAIPLQSIEGFIRQIIGWREFMHHAYMDYWETWRTANGLQHTAALPQFFWTGETKMACVSRVVNKLKRTGHAHHIERLMVLGNFALLLGVNPQQVDAWFLETFIDALPWVVTPNVVAMSQFADLGTITSKPYIAGGAYVSRMGDDCGNCFYDPKITVGDRACPLSTLYWNFIDRHAKSLGKNPRMGTQIRAWAGREASVKKAIRARGSEVHRLAQSGEL